jgi:hypothetical protein
LRSMPLYILSICSLIILTSMENTAYAQAELRGIRISRTAAVSSSLLLDETLFLGFNLLFNFQLHIFC